MFVYCYHSGYGKLYWSKSILLWSTLNKTLIWLLTLQYVVLLLLQYPVSDFSHNLLERVRGEPLFNILDINGRLLRKVQTLQRITLSRLQLRFSRPFLASCRLGAEWVKLMGYWYWYVVVHSYFEYIYIYIYNTYLKMIAVCF